MASIFVSHSTRDDRPTREIAAWLRRLGYDDIFVDFDKNDGISPGLNWKGELAAAMKRAQVVLLLVSDNWSASVWCQAEHTTAVMLGKQIVPVVLSAPGEGDGGRLRQAVQSQIGDLQFVDLTQDWADGLARLEIVLDRSRVTPLAFAVPSDAAPYRGLKAYTAQEAGLFFARERETQELFEQLRQLAAPANTDRLLVLLGASGAGKSSLLRAGLWPQLALRPREWLALEPMIPEQNDFSGTTPAVALARAIAETFGRYENPRNPADLILLLESETPDSAFSRISEELRALAGGPQATVVLGIDQAEELLRAEAAKQTRFLELLAGFLAGSGRVAIITIRSDTFNEVQEDRLLEGIPFTVYPVAPMPLARIPEVIRGPAARVGLRVDDVLVDRATEDAKTGDALPLLSFTLERLWRDHAREGDLTAEAYESLATMERGARVSPMENSVRLAAEEAIVKLDAAAENALAEAFVPGLVDLTDGLEPVRRRAPWTFMPEKAIPLLKKLVEARLLISDRDTVEIVHEALLRRWPMLATRIEAAKPDLRRLQEVERAAADWLRAKNANPKDGRAELIHQGERLARANKLVRRPGWRHRLGTTGVSYLEACGGAQRRRRMNVIAAVAAFIITAGAVVGVYRQSDDYAVRRMLASSPGLGDNYELAPGRAAVLVRAGLRNQAVDEIRRMSRMEQDDELCDTGLRLLDSGKRADAKYFIKLLLGSDSFLQQARRTGFFPFGGGKGTFECLNAAFLVGLGDQAIAAIEVVLPTEAPNIVDWSALDTLGEQFLIFSTDKQFSTGLTQATTAVWTKKSLNVLTRWLGMAPKARALRIVQSLRAWRALHPRPVCSHEQADILRGNPGSGSADDIAKLTRLLVALGERDEVQNLKAYECSGEGFTERSPGSTKQEARVGAGQERADWIAWASGDAGRAHPETATTQGKCDALVSLLSPRGSRTVPEPEDAIRKLLQEIRGLECDTALAQWVQRPIVLPTDGKRNEPPQLLWRDYFVSVQRALDVLAKSKAGATVKRELYWRMVRTLASSGDAFPVLARLVRERAHYLPLPKLDEGDAQATPLMATLTEISPGAPFPARLPLASVQSPDWGANGVCVQVLTGLGRAYLGRVPAAREGISRGETMIRDYQREGPWSADAYNALGCIVVALASIGDYDEAEQIASSAEMRPETRDSMFRNIAVQQAGRRDFKRAREAAGKISYPAAQRQVETEILMIWQDGDLDL